MNLFSLIVLLRESATDCVGFCALFPVTCSLGFLRSLQLRKLLHQFFQAESWKLYSNLGVFSFAFALIDSTFAIFRMFHPLAGPERSSALRLLHRNLRPCELLAARSEELSYVVDRVVLWARIAALPL